MNIKQGIEIAIRGGYCPKQMNDHILSGFHLIGVYGDHSNWNNKENTKTIAIPHEVILLDSLFFKALGKEMGWGGSAASWVATDAIDWWCNDCSFGLKKQKIGKPLKEFRNGTHVGCPKAHPWKQKQLQFIKLLQEGKDIEEAFSEIMK